MKSLRTPVVMPLLLSLLILLAACVAPAAPAPIDAQDESTTTASTDPAAFPVTVTHDRGELTLEKPAARLVVFSEEFIELFVALDLAPVGVALWRNEPTGETFTQLPYLEQPIPGAPFYLNGDEPNLEALVALQPDLILHHDYADNANAELYDSLSQIAPTLAYSGATIGGWKRALRGLAQATGRREQAEAIITDYDARVVALQAAMAPVVEQAPTVTVLLSGIDFVGVFDERFAIGGLLETLGFTLTVPSSVMMDPSGYINISPEILGEITADSLMTLRFDNDQEHVSDPILGSLTMPVLRTEIRPGMGYTGPFAEIIYLEGFAKAFSAQYLPAAAQAPVTSATLQVVSETDTERVIQHAGGKTTIPANPQCIVVAGSGYLDHLLTLGVTPCGAAHGPGGSGFPTYFADQVADVEYVGGTLEVSLETVALVDPDLIIAMHPAHTEGDFFTDFTPLAPTVYLTEPWQDWRQALVEMGMVLGKQAVAVAKLAEFDAKLAAAKTQLAETVGDEKVLFLRVLPQEIRVYGTASPTGDLLFTRLGLTPSALTPIGESAQPISLELVPDIDANHIFLLDQTEDNLATLNASSLWASIPAVQQGNVYPVDVKIWIQGEGMFAYNLLVDDVLATLTSANQ